MSTAAPGELNASTVISLIESGAYPRDTVVTIARGFLPLPQEEMIGVLAYLSAYNDPEVVGFARTSLNDIPSRNMFDFASNENLDPTHLVRLMNVSSEGMVLEALIRNRAVPNEAVIELARRADAHVQEVIVINHARILRAPEILDALLANPNLSPDAGRRVSETREEFFEKKARLKAMEEFQEPDMIEAPLDAIADLLERAIELEHQQPEVAKAATLQPLAEGDQVDEKKVAIWNRLITMTVSEKVQLAFKGDRMVRMLLIRDRNKLICSSVMRNPRMSESEAEAIAGMRNVDDEVLRILGNRRDWMGKYKIMITLLRNPKAPIGVVLPFINRLTLRDLKNLKDDRGVQQVVREMAKRAYAQQSNKP
jgi:hypothetical protein